jgi:RNA polymerase sigma-70 factor (ECF subfamily)
VAKNRAIDQHRRRARWLENEKVLASETDESVEMSFDEHEVRDDALRLIFTCCHPSLGPEAQIALTLRTVSGLSSEQVAQSFLLKPTALQQRIVRAKRKIDHAGIPYVIPDRESLPERLSAVLRTIYLVFNEGYKTTDGETLMRRELCDEGIRLARLVSELMPERAEPKALLALMLLHHSRRRARTDARGDLVTLGEQDRTLWDRALVDEALPLVEEGLRGRPVSAYAIEAAIAALHARAETADATDWAQIAALYAVLEGHSGDSPVVALNAAVAVGMAGDLDAGLRRLDTLDRTGVLADYHLLHAARGDFLERLGRAPEARACFERALELTANPVERRFMERRLSILSADEKK